jgi:hypothetical protein
VLVGVSNTPIVLFLELVLRSVRSGITPKPELLDELVTLLVVRKLLKR